MPSYITEVGAAAMRWLSSGRLYAASVANEALASNGTITLYLANPEDSGKLVLVTYIEAASDGQGTLNIYLDPSVSDTGTSVTPIPLNRNTLTTPSTQVSTGPTFAAGSETITLITPGGEGRRSVGSHNGFRPALILPPGEGVILEFKNRAGATVAAHLYVEFYEEM